MAGRFDAGHTGHARAVLVEHEVPALHPETISRRGILKFGPLVKPISGNLSSADRKRLNPSKKSRRSFSANLTCAESVLELPA